MTTPFPLFTTASIFFRLSHPWTFLFILEDDKRHKSPFCEYSADGGVLTRTDWQHNFTSLKTLTVDIRTNCPGTTIGNQRCLCYNLKALSTVLGCGTTKIRAKKVAVKMSVMTCRTGTCERRLTSLLQNIVEGDSGGAKD